MLEKKLEIILITYNRSRDLDNTLKQLLQSPFLNCKFTILDNCSTDNTPYICAKYQKLFPKIEIKRHEKNIGANPNILRAVETSNSLYTWILCDDDEYDFSDCSDVINQIKTGNLDLIIVTDHCQYGWERGLKTTSKELIEKGTRYFHTLSFVPSIIFKTDLFDSNSIAKGYFNIHNLFPHFEFINKSFEENFSVYVSKKAIIHRGNHNPGHYSSLEWFISWIGSCLIIRDKKVRKKTIYEFDSNESFIYRLVTAIITEKVIQKYSRKNIISLFTNFVLAFGFSKELTILVLILPLTLIPSFLYYRIIKLYRFTKYRLRGKEEPEFPLNNKNSDSLRF